MGNTLSSSVTSRPGGALDGYVVELGGGVIYERSMGSARFLKTVKARHRNGPVVVKIFIKPDPGLSLRLYYAKLKTEREALVDLPNVYGYQTFAETERAGYLIRQWVASNLYDRISTRPFLSAIEKKWIAFQILSGLRDARTHNIAHGDVKSENILVTSWNWVYLTDFSSFKPVHLPEDDPSDFSFYFDTSGRRTCYLAPERFFASGGKSGKGREREARVTEAMDVFSAGCVLAELFLDGTQVFTLSQLFKYRSGELALDNHLAGIEDNSVKSLIKRMMSLNPSLRPSFDEALTDARDLVFPESFYSFFHDYIAALNEPSSSPFHAPATENGESTPGLHPQQQQKREHEQRLPSDSDHRLQRLWEDFDSFEPYLIFDGVDTIVPEPKKETERQEEPDHPYKDVFPVVVQIPNVSRDFSRDSDMRRQAAYDDGPALIILALICANLRNCYHAGSKLRAFDLLLAVAPYLTDEAKLDRLVPYVIDMLHDESALVRAAALRTLVQTLQLVRAITPSNAAIFPEYIFPNVRDLVHDPEVSVRCMYALCMVKLSECGRKFLEMDQAMKAHGTFKLVELQEGDAPQERSYDESLEDVKALIQEELVTLLVEPSSAVKRAVLHKVADLCVFFGRQKTNDVLLSHMITFLNDRDWLLRYAFFDSIIDVAICVGARSLEEYILPLMFQALSDSEESVVSRVLASLTNLAYLGLFPKMRIWELMGAMTGLLYHPNIWIRQGAAAFFSTAAKRLSSIDTWSILYPSLRPLFTSDVSKVDELSILSTIKPPLARHIFDAAVMWALKREKSQFWKAAGVKDFKSRGDVGKESMRRSVLVNSRSVLPRSEEDDQQIAKLQQLGMTIADEAKLLALSEYILKLALPSGSFMSRSKLESDSVLLLQGVDVQLQQLGVRPTTLFLGSRSSESLRADHQRRGGNDATMRKSLSMQSSLRLPHSPAGSNRPHSPQSEGRRKGVPFVPSQTPMNHTPTSTHMERRDSSVSLQSQATDIAATSIPQLTRPVEVPPSSPVSSQFPSLTDSSALRRMNRLPVNSEGFKALPAVGSSKTIAVGHLEAPMHLRTEDDVPISGRSSPLSTVRPESRLRYPTPGYSTAWEGQEPGISNMIEDLYRDTFRESIPEFGPRIVSGPIRRRSAVRASFPPQDGVGRRSEATLIAHLTTHTGAINGIAVAPDHAFFVSCSNDKTVQVWDTSRLSNNVTSNPRHVYTQHHTRVTCVCMIEASHCFASAGDDGSLHVVRVTVAHTGSQPRYAKLQMVREHQVEASAGYISCLAHYNSETSSNLVYATTMGHIVVLDLRNMRTLIHMVSPIQHGSISCICLDRRRACLVTGTLSGVLTLWDLRFGLQLRSWKVATSALSPNARSAIHQCVPHPTKGAHRWIVVAVEALPTRDIDSTVVRSTVLEVWDVENAVLVETFMHAQEASNGETSALPHSMLPKRAQEAEKTAASAIEELVKSRSGASARGGGALFSRNVNQSKGTKLASTPEYFTEGAMRPDIRAIVIGADFGGFSAMSQANAGVVEEEVVHRDRVTALQPSKDRAKESKGFILTGCEDRRIRFWDTAKVGRSFIIGTPLSDGEKSTFSSPEAGTYVEAWSARPVPGGRNPPRHTLLGHQQQQLLRAHQDCITALATIDSPFRGGIISGDRAGVIKVFRIECN